MPKELTHILFADAVAADLESGGRTGLASLLRRDRATLHFGSIATDTLFYGFTLPVLDRDFHPWGDIIHGEEGEDTGTPIREMLERLRDGTAAKSSNASDDAKFVFVCGFLTHMALDIVFHPWVYAVTGQYYDADPVRRMDSQMRHRLVESWLDLLMLRRQGNDLAHSGLMEAVRRNGTTNLACLGFFADCFRAAWRIDGDVGRYARRFYRIQMLLTRMFASPAAMKVTARANRMAGGRLRSFLALFYPADPDRMPMELFAFDGYRHPVTGERVAATLESMWNDARRLAVDLLTAAHDVRNGASPDVLDAVLGGRSLDVGLSGCPATRAVHFDIFPSARMWGYPGPITSPR
ncbi:zinc dependent phospholipase C family protein [Skermanella mucosa]|uniref:zinc dependent phospholipase C family protein n=1 Tax=Skermanella mucosa TaxID=1789672 RepID=UPI00192C0A4A|nr:zinc dependent phospholipase C family protein [Skermanella mucosa]UEM23619.1 zinc dependent phospholipase C family protein [Skermanella mucosa]